MSGTQVVLAAAVAAVVIFAVLVAMGREESQREKARLREVREWTDAHGWTFASGNPRPPWRNRPPREGLELGLLLEGQVGGHDATIACGAYDVQRASANLGFGNKRIHTAAYQLTVLTVRAEDGTPEMEIRERGLGVELMRSLARNATDADAFDARFEVMPPEARGRLTEEAIQAHLDGVVPAWSVRSGEIMAVLPGRTRAEDLDACLAVLERLGEIVATTWDAPGPGEER